MVATPSLPLLIVLNKSRMICRGHIAKFSISLLKTTGWLVGLLISHFLQPSPYFGCWYMCLYYRFWQVKKELSGPIGIKERLVLDLPTVYIPVNHFVGQRHVLLFKHEMKSWICSFSCFWAQGLHIFALFKGPSCSFVHFVSILHSSVETEVKGFGCFRCLIRSL